MGSYLSSSEFVCPLFIVWNGNAVAHWGGDGGIALLEPQ